MAAISAGRWLGLRRSSTLIAMKSSALTRVYIVEDSPSVRACLVDLVEGIEGGSIVGEADTPHGAIAGIRAAQPDCVILDFQLVGGTGVEVLRAIHRESPQIVFVVLSNHSSLQYRRLCIGAGARWFFDKSTEFGKLKDVLSGLDVSTQSHPHDEVRS